MLDQLLNFISEQKLIQPGHKTLLAVSGGIDSMVLAHLFSQTSFNFEFAHCNFQLRGNDSEGDQQLVESTANSYQVTCHTKRFATEEFAKKNGISIQMAARSLRREWFEELLENKGIDQVATAHHLNDSLETVLFNLARGTGISGLRGILPKNGRYIRPLMFASRNMIIDYASSNHLNWREDISNSAIKYHRNLIRHKVVPELKKINPNIESTLYQSLQKLAATERLYKSTIAQHKKTLIQNTKDGFTIDKEKLAKLEEAPIILFEILDEYGFNFHQANDILKSLKGQVGKTFFASEYQLTVDRNFLFISKSMHNPFTATIIYEDTKQVATPHGELSFDYFDAKNVTFDHDHNTAFLDASKLKFPLKIRQWQQGDRFQPLGMKHKKKLSDFMIDEKIPLNLKDQVLVLCSEENLVWVIGWRIDDRYKITKNTSLALSIFNRTTDDQPV